MEQNNFTRRMFIKGVTTSFGALPVFAWPRWAQAFYYNLGFFKKGAAASTYVEDVFSTYLYTGAASTGTLPFVNGIDLTQGGLVWLKERSNIGFGHYFFDTARGTGGKYLTSSTTAAEATDADTLSGFNNNGWTIGRAGLSNNTGINSTGATYASWTFRKAAKFFDVVTYTGNGNAGGQTVAHSLGSDPGMVIIKRTDAVDMWIVHHRSQAGKYLQLESTAAATTFSWITTSSTNFVLANNGGAYNAAGATYVAYLFAHDTSTDGLVQCGSVTTDASGNATVSLGWEPQYVLLKYSSATSNWNIHDSMRGMPVGGADYYLTANLSVQELSYDEVDPTATGMNIKGLAANTTVIYLAIRRGPMKTPTAGTQVYNAIVENGTGVNPRVLNGVGFPPDLMIISDRPTAGGKHIFYDRLRGPNSSLAAYSTASETGLFGGSDGVSLTQNGVNIANIATALNGGVSFVHHFFRRAPGFFDQVCYSGNDVASRTVTHGLKVAPELMIVKSRGTGNWYVWYSPDGTAILNSSAAGTAGDRSVFGAAPTSSVFTCDNASVFDINASGVNYVAYLFASCPGVSKIGSYTGAATDVTVSCGFSGLPRFVLVKRADGVGDWIVVDSARGTSVYLTLNTTNAETSAIVITFTTGGFVAKAGTVANAASGANYIFLAIA